MPVRVYEEQDKRDKGGSKAAAVVPAVANSGPRQENPLTRGRAFLADVRGEMTKVSSPSRAEVQTTTTVVILAVFTFAAFFYVVDTVLGYLLKALLHSLGGS